MYVPIINIESFVSQYSTSMINKCSAYDKQENGFTNTLQIKQFLFNNLSLYTGFSWLVSNFKGFPKGSRTQCEFLCLMSQNLFFPFINCAQFLWLGSRMTWDIKVNTHPTDVPWNFIILLWQLLPWVMQQGGNISGCVDEILSAGESDQKFWCYLPTQ